MGPLRLAVRRLGAQLAGGGAVLPLFFRSIECDNIQMKLVQGHVEGAVKGSLGSRAWNSPPNPL